MRVWKRSNRGNKILRLLRLICSLQVATFPSSRPRNQVLQKSIPPSFIRDGFISDISRDSRTGKFLSLKDTFLFLPSAALLKDLWKYRRDSRLVRLKSPLSTSYYKVLLKKMAITNIKSVQGVLSPCDPRDLRAELKAGKRLIFRTIVAAVCTEFLIGVLLMWIETTTLTEF